MSNELGEAKMNGMKIDECNITENKSVEQNYSLKYMFCTSIDAKIHLALESYPSPLSPHTLKLELLFVVFPR